MWHLIFLSFVIWFYCVQRISLCSRKNNYSLNMRLWFVQKSFHKKGTPPFATFQLLHPPFALSFFFTYFFFCSIDIKLNFIFVCTVDIWILFKMMKFQPTKLIHTSLSTTIIIVLIPLSKKIILISIGRREY